MATDNFTRANETPLASPWVSDSSIGGLNLASNTAHPGAGDGASTYTGSTGGVSEVTLMTGSGGGCGPSIMSNAAGNFYTCVGNYFGSLFAIIRYDSGVDTFIANTSGTYTAADVIKLRRSGNDVILSKNGTDVLTATDTTYMTGTDGIYSNDPANGFSAWNNGAASGPSLSDVDGDENIYDGQTGVAVTGAAMGTTNTDRTFTLRQGSVSVPQTETGTGTATAATLTATALQSGADLKFGTATVLRVTRTSDSTTGDITVTFSVPAGNLYVDATTPNATAAYRISASSDIVSGDQIQARGVGGGAAPTGLTIYADATFGFDSGATPTQFDVRVWDTSDSTWSAWATQSIPLLAYCAANGGRSLAANNGRVLKL